MLAFSLIHEADKVGPSRLIEVLSQVLHIPKDLRLMVLGIRTHCRRSPKLDLGLTVISSIQKSYVLD